VRRTRGWLFGGALLIAAAPAFAAPRPALVYPQPPRADVVDTYWGTPVPDPYRPLENVDAPATQAWLRDEAALTRRYLDALPYRAAIASATRGMAPASAAETPIERHGAFWSSSRGEPGKRPVILVRDAALQPDRVLLDENALPANVTVALSEWSRSGRLFAYATETNGSDWLTWRVRDVATATDLPDVIRWSKFGGVAFNGDDGFYYSGYDAPAPGHESDAVPPGPYKAFYHRLGTAQSGDLLLATAAGPDQWPWTRVTDDGRYALTVTGPGENNGWDVFPADRPEGPRATLVGQGPGQITVIGNAGTRFFFWSHRDAPNGRIVAIDADDPHHGAHVIVPERSDALADASFIAGRLYLVYLHDVYDVLEVADTQGRSLSPIPLPGLGSVTTPVSDGDDASVYFTYESFIEPRTTFRYDVATKRTTAVARQPVQFDSSAYVTEQLFATSRDGVRVPVFVTHRRDMRYDGSTPTILWGYGAGGDVFTVTPYFGSTNALWLRFGGAYAVVNARGGGEYGERWHRAAMLGQKQHTFDDVIAAAQLLVDRKITSPAKLALSGASWGGLMVGAVVTERPDLFAAATSSAGIYDMVRFPISSAGAPTASEMGRADQSEAAFRALYAYSPLHNVRTGRIYPAMLIATGDRDDRVAPSESYKFAAALQQAQAGDAPILLRVTANAGHDYGPAGSAANSTADRYAFLFKALNFKPSLP